MLYPVLLPQPGTTQAITDPTAVLVGGSLSLAGDALSRELLLGPGPNTALRTAIVEHFASFGLPVAFDDVLIVSVGVANGTASAGGQQRRLRLLSVSALLHRCCPVFCYRVCV